ncbi:MAG: tetratricopeptide repeat protein [Myxococcota bacterium]
MSRFFTYILLIVCLAVMIYPFELLAQETECKEEPAKKCEPKKDKVDLKSEQKGAATEKKTESVSAPGLKPESEYDRLIKEVTQVVEQFEKAATEYKQEIVTIVKLKRDTKRESVLGIYEKSIQQLEAEQRSLRDTAIARLEEFLRKYPNDPRYTPHAMFRLAELYFEKATDEYFMATDSYAQLEKDYEDGKIKSLPEKPRKRLENCIKLYQRIVSDFPDYQYMDAVYYLLGYALYEQDEKKEAVEVFYRLVQNYPKSKFYAESWMRIGNYYFDDADPPELDKAIDSYRKAMVDKESILYPNALYKLAWTYYRKDDLAKAVNLFADLIEFYDAKKGTDIKLQSEMRPESIKYIAICFADDHWSNSGVSRLIEFFKQRKNPPYEKEVFLEMGDLLYQTPGLVLEGKSNFAAAVEAYKHYLTLDPYSPQAPLIQEKIINSYLIGEKDNEAASRERMILVRNYSENSEWFKRNKDDPEARANANSLIERALYTAALYIHQQAQFYKNAGKQEEAIEYFKKAADAYAEYLRLFKNSKEAYEMNYYYADALYYSLRFLDAAREYENVRDSPAGTQYKRESAIYAPVAYEDEINRLLKEKKIEEYTTWQAKDIKDPSQIKPLPIDELRQKYISAIEYVIKNYPDYEKVPDYQFTLALVYYQRFHIDEARERLKFIVDKYPKSDRAKVAARLITQTYLVYKDWINLAKVTEDFQKKGFGDEKFNEEMNILEGGALFSYAMTLFEAKKYEEAATELIKFVNKKPKHEYADKALQNAAYAFEMSRRFESAATVYERIFKEYPKSSFADEALFKVAYNQENGFKFEEAINNYLMLVEKYPESKNRAPALFNAANALENLQRYDEAARQYLRFAEMFPNHEKAPFAFYKSIIVYEKAKDYNNLIKTAEKYINKFYKDPKQGGTIVELTYKIGETYEKMKNMKLARQYYDKTIAEFEKRRLPPGNNKPAYLAAKCEFMKAEELFAQYEKIKIGGTQNQKILKQQLNEKAKWNLKVEEAYSNIAKYLVGEWILAAMYKIGYAKQRFAESFYEAPLPKELKTEEEKIVYQSSLAEFAAPIEEAAIALYEKARKKAIELKVVNEWTKKTLESLNKLSPNKYPLMKDPINIATEDFVAVNSFDAITKVEMLRDESLQPPAQKIEEKGLQNVQKKDEQKPVNEAKEGSGKKVDEEEEPKKDMKEEKRAPDKQEKIEKKEETKKIDED